MMNVLFFAILTVFLIIFQTVVFPSFFWFSQCFDLMIMNVIFLSLLYSHYAVILTIILVGGIMDSFGTALSIALQYGVPLEVLVNKFSHTRFEPMGHTSNKDIRILDNTLNSREYQFGLEQPILRRSVGQHRPTRRIERGDKIALGELLDIRADGADVGDIQQAQTRENHFGTGEQFLVRFVPDLAL